VVIGSEAVAFHGVPRFSVDFDVFVRPSTANLFRIKAALEASGLGDLSAVDPEIWAKSEPPLQIDILRPSAASNTTPQAPMRLTGCTATCLSGSSVAPH
jgi:hypothetical protein